MVHLPKTVTAPKTVSFCSGLRERQWKDEQNQKEYKLIDLERNLQVQLDVHQFSSVQFSSVAQSCLTLCNPMNHSTPGFPVHHQLPEFIQTHVHPAGDAIQPSHPLSSPSPPDPNPSQHQGLFQ